jgi:D-inositol-3-phosphate glycosyltransferase
MFDRWVDLYAVTSAALIDCLVRTGVHPSKLMVVPPAIDTTVYRPGDQLAARAALGIDPHEALVVYLGRLSPNRFPADVVARGLQQAAGSTAQHVRFVGLSPGQTYDGSENTAAYLLACTRAAAAEMRDLQGVSVDIRLGDLAEREKVLWLQAADTVLLPFAHVEAVEPPLTLLEALACGATMLVTAAANRSGVIRDGQNGHVYEGYQLGEQLAKVLSRRGNTASLADCARATVVAGYSFSATVDASERVWSRVAEQRRSGTRIGC